MKKRSFEVRVVLTSAAVALSTACAPVGSVEVPVAQEEDYYFATDLLHTLECELNDAVESAKRIDERFARQAVAATLTLTVTEVQSAGANGTLVVPIGTSSLTFKPSYTP